jgi:glutamate-1-semialdehyde 2,1-aminomutase
MSILEEYLRRTPTSKELYARACRSLPGGYTRGPFQHNPYPTFMKRASGSKIWDVDGNEYIDYVNNFGPLILGHANPKVMEAVKHQLDTLWLGGPAEVELDLAERVTKLVPCAKKVLFCPTGSEACMKAIRTYRAIRGKDKIAMFEGAYHGCSDSLLFSEGIPKDLLSKIIKIPFNNIEKLEQAVRTNKDELAAFFVEPTIGEMGHEPAKPDFYRAIRDITEENDVPLIFDEIVDGFRIAPGGAQERFGVRADMATLGKILGGGFPLAAYASSEETMNVWAVRQSNSLDVARSRLAHPGTFNDFKIAMAAGLATIDQLTKDAYEHLETIGDEVRGGLKKICSDLGVRTQVVGIGSLFHLFFTDSPIVDMNSVRRSNNLLYRYFELAMLNRGINLGKAHCSLCSAAITRTDVRKTLDASKETLTQMRPLIADIAPNLIEKR